MTTKLVLPPLAGRVLLEGQILKSSQVTEGVESVSAIAGLKVKTNKENSIEAKVIVSLSLVFSFGTVVLKPILIVYCNFSMVQLF